MYVFLSPKFRPRCKDIFCVDDQVQIQDLVKGDPASEAESCRHSGVELCEQCELSVARV